MHDGDMSRLGRVHGHGAAGGVDALGTGTEPVHLDDRTCEKDTVVVQIEESLAPFLGSSKPILLGPSRLSCSIRPKLALREHLDA